jgi:hypothetical protein
MFEKDIHGCISDKNLIFGKRKLQPGFLLRKSKVVNRPAPQAMVNGVLVPKSN